MTLRERLAGCKGRDASRIASELSGDDQDEVTREILTMLGERTRLGSLPKRPFVVRNTMYGDEDVSDWLVSYTDAGFDVTPCPGDSAADVHLRWEHWEDAVRFVNGDVTQIALNASRRLANASVGADLSRRRAVGIQVIDENANAWFGALADAGDPGAQLPGAIISGLRVANAKGPQERDVYVRSIGFETIVKARSVTAGAAMVEAGARDELAGSFLRWEIESNPPMGIHVDFAPITAARTVRLLTRDELGNADIDGGVTIRYASADAFLDQVSGAKGVRQQMAAGTVRMFGSEERLNNYAAAMRKLGGQ